MYVRSASVRNFAVSGKSCGIKNDATATSTVASPSSMNTHAQPGRPPIPSMLCIAAASRPPRGGPVRRDIHIPLIAKRTKRAGDRGGREEQRDTCTEFRALVPAASISHSARLEGRKEIYHDR